MSNVTAGWPGWLLGAIALTVVPVTSLPGSTSPSSAEAASTDGVRTAAVTAGWPERGPLLVAHRGASGYAPENTVAAAEAAAETRTTWVETDVQRTSDGELVLMHDTTLARTTNVEEVFPDRAPWRVADFTAEEISRLDAGSWFGEEFAGEPVPTLTEFLDELGDNRQRLLLELKSPELYPGIEAEILDELGEQGWLREWYPGQRVVLQSFDADSVRTVHGLAPRVETGFLGTPPVDEIPEYAEFADQINPRHADLTEEYVASVQSVRGPHGRPLKVYTWTVNDGELANRVAALGVDGIISDVPDVVRAALRD
ncbi:glycerophosphodiester phosphodiesterase [Streptomyces sp. 3MP-14]|uniref:Glycerophosphodiester phosphodiesterase n=1 Tax=Streptomyces mimosae TaxID=2586635 RepID=A0A5N6AKN7_9ACTN|nr:MULTISPECIES: glycerophosphodiester phosphodiesterase family protein [Streptomyces]KAB8168775.1 glycerophosphodiester phosphodiesterase [Streptomyces mimosae]KAB8177945.1 glycerophosphodiester phosphodiesterase [Streptomyces sp. 3MP-14]